MSKILSTPVSTAAVERFLNCYGYADQVQKDAAGRPVLRTDAGKTIALDSVKSRGDLVGAMLQTTRGAHPELLGHDFDAAARHHSRDLTVFFNDHFKLGDDGEPTYALDSISNSWNRSDVPEAERREFWLSNKSFGVPCVKLAPGQGEAYTVPGIPDDLRRVCQSFVTADGGLRLPIHPVYYNEFTTKSQAALRLAQMQPGETLTNTRSAASIRTFQLDKAVTGAPTCIKLSLPIYHNTVKRPIAANDAKHCVHVTAELLAAIGRDPELQKCLAILPEGSALLNYHDPADESGTSGAVVRTSTPYPSLPGKKTFAVSLFTMGRRDLREPNQSLAKTPMQYFLENRPDQNEDAIDYYLRTFEKPLLTAFWRLYLEHGLGFTIPHQQNVLAEVDEGGRPTGRIVFTDLEEFFEAKERRQALGLKSFQATYGQDGDTRIAPLSDWSADDTMYWAFSVQMCRSFAALRAGFDSYAQGLGAAGAGLVDEMKQRSKDMQRALHQTFRDQRYATVLA